MNVINLAFPSLTGGNSINFSCSAQSSNPFAESEDQFSKTLPSSGLLVSDFKIIQNIGNTATNLSGKEIKLQKIPKKLFNNTICFGENKTKTNYLDYQSNNYKTSNSHQTKDIKYKLKTSTANQSFQKNPNIQFQRLDKEIPLLPVNKRKLKYSRSGVKNIHLILKKKIPKKSSKLQNMEKRFIPIFKSRQLSPLNLRESDDIFSSNLKGYKKNSINIISENLKKQNHKRIKSSNLNLNWKQKQKQKLADDIESISINLLKNRGKAVIREFINSPHK